MHYSQDVEEPWEQRTVPKYMTDQSFPLLILEISFCTHHLSNLFALWSANLTLELIQAVFIPAPKRNSYAYSKTEDWLFLVILLYFYMY